MKATAIALLCALGVGWAASWGWADIVGSKHDFRSAGASSRDPGNPKELCAFCHTPTGGETPRSAPLWSPRTEAGTFPRYASLGSANLEAEGLAVGSVSLACLSCHDGTQALDVVYRPRTEPAARGAPAWLDNRLSNDGTLFWQPEDVRNDHPVGVSYAGGACAGVAQHCDPAAMTVGNRDFHPARFETINAQGSWWVDTAAGMPGMRDKSDMILYARTVVGVVGPSVECGSCHDPHDGTPRPVSFLRLPSADSTVCLACHLK